MIDYSLTEIEAMLPYILKRRNIAHFEDNAVYIGNRTVYPFEKSFVRCDDVEQVALAIENMVTQGGGPWVAAAYAMALQAEKLKASSERKFSEGMNGARTRLVATRPTNTLIRYRLEDLCGVALTAYATDADPTAKILDRIKAIMDEMYINYATRAQYAENLLEEGDGVLTMCFAETSFLLTMAMAKKAGKRLTAYVPETRPYLQGARLTAPSLHEIGIEVRLITDNMPTAIMAEGKIHKYMTAADLVTLSGHVVNKVGTFQNAIAARHHKIPFYAFAWGSDPNKPDRESIEIEYRDPAEIRECRGVATTLDDIGSLYPAFDITPPELVTGVVTRHGILNPHELKDGFE